MSTMDKLELAAACLIGKRVTNEEQDRRMKICSECPSLRPNEHQILAFWKCKHCGCPLSSITKRGICKEKRW